MIQIVARPILKNSGFRGTVKFDFASFYLRCYNCCNLSKKREVPKVYTNKEVLENEM